MKAQILSVLSVPQRKTWCSGEVKCFSWRWLVTVPARTWCCCGKRTHTQGAYGGNKWKGGERSQGGGGCVCRNLKNKNKNKNKKENNDRHDNGLDFRFQFLILLRCLIYRAVDLKKNDVNALWTGEV